MAGSRMYYSNVLTSARGQVEIRAKLQLVSGASPALTVVAGKGSGLKATAFSTVGSTSGQSNNGFTLQLPEKFANCLRMDATVVPVAGIQYTGTLAVDYNPATGLVTFGVVTSTGGVLTAAPNGTYLLYFQAVFELGM